MMKKHFVFILVIALVFMLPSCSKDKELTQKVEDLEEAVKTLVLRTTLSKNRFQSWRAGRIQLRTASHSKFLNILLGMS